MERELWVWLLERVELVESHISRQQWRKDIRKAVVSTMLAW